MQFACEKCATRYSIADERVRGRRVSIRCGRCGASVVLDGRATPVRPAEEETRVAPEVELADLRARCRQPAGSQAAANGLGDGWFVVAQGRPEGPLSAAELRARIERGEVGPRTYLWREGQQDWKRARELEAVAPLLPAFPEPAPPAGEPRAPRAPAADEVTRLVSQEPSSGAAGEAPAAAPGSPVSSAGAQEAAGAEAKAPVEDTRFFMARAGVTRRNPPWKIALAVASAVALPVCVLYLLTQLRVVRLDITTVDEETGQAVEKSVFSPEGLGGLRDLLLGKAPPRAAPVKPRHRAAAASAREAADDGPLIQRPKIDFAMSEEERSRAALIYAEADKVIAGPRQRKESEEAVELDGASSLAPQVINDAIAKNLRAFQLCNENELRRNPKFKGGKVRVTFTIGPSGIVTRAAIDRPDIDRGELGACLKEKAKRVVFPAFEGEPFDVEVPLVLVSAP